MGVFAVVCLCDCVPCALLGVYGCAHDAHIALVCTPPLAPASEDSNADGEEGSELLFLERDATMKTQQLGLPEG